MVNMANESDLPRNGDENSARALLSRLRVCDKGEMRTLIEENFHFADLSFNLLRIMFREVTPESEWSNELERLFGIVIELLPQRMLDDDAVFQGSPPHEKSALGRRMQPKRQRTLLTRVWIRLLSMNLPEDLMTRAMIVLGNGEINKMNNSELLGDVIMNSLDSDSELGVASSRAIYHLMVEHNVEYPDIYKRLYHLLGMPNILNSPHCLRFLDDLDVFLTSLHLPSNTLAAFAKRIVRLALRADVTHVKTLISMVTSIMRRHPTVQCLLHRDSRSKEPDPYDPSIESPENSGALDSSLRELYFLKEHWDPEVSKMVSRLLAKAPEVRVIEEKPSEIFEKAEKEMKKQTSLALKHVRSLRKSNAKIVTLGNNRKRKLNEDDVS